MHIAEGAFKHRSITQFGELTKAPSDHPPVFSAAPPSPAAKPAGALPHLTFSIAVSSSLSALRGHQALARRGQRTQHVPWRGGKLVRLVGERLGGNARVQAIATLKGGQRDESRATLKCAAELRRVVQYPLVNTTVLSSGCTHSPFLSPERPPTACSTPFRSTRPCSLRPQPSGLQVTRIWPACGMSYGLTAGGTLAPRPEARRAQGAP